MESSMDGAAKRNTEARSSTYSAGWRDGHWSTFYPITLAAQKTVSILTTIIGPSKISDHVTEEMFWQKLKVKKRITVSDTSHITGTVAIFLLKWQPNKIHRKLFRSQLISYLILWDRLTAWRKFHEALDNREGTTHFPPETALPEKIYNLKNNQQ